jgi:hypothetical protein
MGRRLTITLDDDVAARLDEAARRTGAPVEEVASDALRRALPEKEAEKVKGTPYVFPPGTTIQLKPGVNIDCIQELLDQIEGPDRKW